MMWWDGMGWGWMWFGGIFGIVLLVIIIFAVVWAIRRSTEHTGTGRDATGILRERYARGEITREEFERMKKDLS